MAAHAGACLLPDAVTHTQRWHAHHHSAGTGPLYPKKIFQYLGRKWHERFDGEVQTWYKAEREPGACLKHFMKRNWLKMYDKLGLLLRVETVINQPGEFKVYRETVHRAIATAAGRKAGLRCARVLATCTTINATPWPATNVTWKP